MYVIINTIIVYVCLECQPYNRTAKTRTLNIELN